LRSSQTVGDGGEGGEGARRLLFPFTIVEVKLAW
jgi:hypothetical protein